MHPPRAVLARPLAAAALAAALLALVPDARAASVTFEMRGTPIIDPATGKRKIFEGGKIPVLELIIGRKDDPNRRVIKIPWAGGSGEEKVAVIRTAILSAKAFDPAFPYPDLDVTVASIDPTKTRGSMTVSGLPKKTPVSFLAKHAGEVDSTRTTGDPIGAIGFRAPAFASVDGVGGTALYVGGIISDFGELAFSLTPSDLPDLRGRTIVAALFAKLDPLVDGFGVDIIDYTPGDEVLTFLFDPDLTETAGVIYGTTAETTGTFGCLEAGEPGDRVPSGARTCDPGPESVPAATPWLSLALGALLALPRAWRVAGRRPARAGRAGARGPRRRGKSG